MLDEMQPAQPVEQHLDITRDVCPMTYVRTRLALDRLIPGQMLRVRLSGEEPRRNVPRTAVEQGHVVISQKDNSDGTTELLLQRGPPPPVQSSDA